MKVALCPHTRGQRVDYSSGPCCASGSSLGFSVQRPVACWPEPPTQQVRWQRLTTLSHYFKNKRSGKTGRYLHRRHQLSPRFTPTRYLEPDLWSPEVSRDWTAQERKIFGALELWKARFQYRHDIVFNASTTRFFWEQLARIYSPGREPCSFRITANLPQTATYGLCEPSQLAEVPSIAFLLSGAELANRGLV